MFYYILFLPDVKRCAIITYNLGIYKLSHELPKVLGLTVLKKYQEIVWSH